MHVRRDRAHRGRSCPRAVWSPRSSRSCARATARGSRTDPGTPTASIVDAYDRLRVPPDQPEYTLRRVWLTRRGGRRATTTASRTRACGRCATSRTRGRCSAPRDWACYQRANQQFADAVHRGDRPARKRRSCWCRTITSRCCRSWSRRRGPTRAWPSSGTFPWPNPEAFGICPVAARGARRPARRRPGRLPHAGALQQLPRDGGSRARIADRSRALHGAAARPRDARAAVPDQRRVPTSRRPAPPRPSAGRCAPTLLKSSASRRGSWASASTAWTTRRASSSASTASSGSWNDGRSTSATSRSCRSARRAGREIPRYRDLVRRRGGRSGTHQRSDSRPPRGSRSCC